MSKQDTKVQGMAKHEFNITHEVHVTFEGLIGDFAWWKLVSSP
jgi:hypothetical protein